MIVSGVVSVFAAAFLFVVWPVLFGLLVKLGQWIAGLGPAGAGIYAFLNRLLIPLGLHHALNNVFWFDTVGIGDLTHFWAGHTSADVGWSLGVYMSGFFPCMMFGVPGAVLAMIRSAKNTNRRAVAGILGSAALCAFVCGITEPFEFAFMFTAPWLYVVYSLLYGIFAYVTALTGFRAGFSFSAGATDLLFSSSLPAASDTWMILPLGLAAFAAFYLTFRFLIWKFNLPTPGTEESETAAAPENAGDEVKPAETGRMKTDGTESGTPEEKLVVEGVDVTALLQGLGGRENILAADNCATRLRMELKDISLLDEQMLKRAGAKGVIKLGKTSAQVIIGLKVQAVADAVRSRLKQNC